MMNDAEELLRASLLKLPSGLAEHVIRVVDRVAHLATLHGVDRQQATLAALGHDILRAHSDERLLRIAHEQSYALDPADAAEPILLHGPLAVAILQEQYGIHDGDVLGAVAWHTTANENMTPLQKVLFLADKTEPHKLDRAPDVMPHIADLAERDLDAAMLAYLDHHIRYALTNSWPLHSHTTAARNQLLAARRGAESARTLPGVERTRERD